MPPTRSASGRFKRTNGAQMGAREGGIGGKFVIAMRMQTLYPRVPERAGSTAGWTSLGRTGSLFFPLGHTSWRGSHFW